MREVLIFCDRECCFHPFGGNEQKANNMEVLLGSSFLRMIYSVFDWNAKAIHYRASFCNTK